MTPPLEEQTLGALVAGASRDLSQLIHKEIELAKTELREEAMRAGKGIGLLGAAAAMALPAALLLLTACALGISYLGISLALGFVVMGGLLGVLALGLAGLGAKKMVKVRPPERTIKTVREDIEWARHPTVAPAPEKMPERAINVG